MSLSNNSQELLILFTRFPQPGSAKTRLIPLLGEQGAARLQRRMTEYMFALAREIREKRDVEVQVHYSGGHDTEVRHWVPAEFRLRPQCKGDLGKRLQSATNTAFAEGWGKIVVIGADCPYLTAEIMAEAFHQLQHADVVIGPALDGGYYLIGLRQQANCLWENVSWGTETVLRETSAHAINSGLSLAYLTPLADIDRPEDLTDLLQSAAAFPQVTDG